MAEEKKYSDEVRVIRTLKTDAEIYAARAENSKFEAALKNPTSGGIFKNLAGPEHKGLRALIITGLALILAVTGAGFYYLSSSKLTEEKTTIKPGANLITADETKIIKLSKAGRDNLVREFTDQLSTPFKNGAFKIIIFSANIDGVESLLDGGRLLEILELRTPPILKNTISALNLGISQAGNILHPFLIFKIKSSTDASVGMLEWEKNMPNDLRAIFRKIPQFGEVNELFSDTVVKNQDARVLNFGDTAVLAYAIYNKNFLILTDSDISLGEIISRYEIFLPRDGE